MENNSEINCGVEENELVLVVEMVNTFNIDGHWFLHKHQFPYIRTEMKKCEERFITNGPYCDHHIVLVEATKEEVAIPEHIGIITNVIKSEIAQDTILYLEMKYRDEINHRWAFYKRYLPIDPSEKHRERAQHRNGDYKDYLNKKFKSNEV